MKFLTLLIVAIAIAGCAAIGPSTSVEFPALLQAGVPLKDGAVQVFGTGTWYPNTKGFTSLRSTLLAKASDPIPGAVALTGTSLVFMQWNDSSKAYEPIKRIAYSEIRDASVDSFGAGRRLVIQRNDYSVDSFELTRAGGNLVDGVKVEEAMQLISRSIARNG